MNLPVENSAAVPLSSLAEMVKTEGVVKIDRENASSIPLSVPMCVTATWSVLSRKQNSRLPRELNYRQDIH